MNRIPRIGRVSGSLYVFPLTVKPPGPTWTTSAKTATFAASMSLVVKLEDDLGERSEWVLLHAVIPTNGDASLPLLSGIDPFGKTVFNHLQMREFLREWEMVKDRVRDESQMEAWERVKQMAETCRHDRDLYLRFVGN